MKIKVFVHLNDLPGAFEVMSEQMTLASESGLLDAAEEVVLCTNGNPDSFTAAKEILNKETGFNLTDYYYKKHNDICIVDFIIPIEKREIELTKSNEIDIKNIEEFDNLKFIEKHNKRQEILSRISYKLLLKIDNDKYISKEEVSTLKTLNDLINQNYIEIIDSIDNLKNIDKFGFNLFKTDRKSTRLNSSH